MAAIFARAALTPQGWRRNVRMMLEGGRIAQILVDAAPEAGDEQHALILPGMPNLHSHAFQRGMAGLAERPGETADSFWTWRETMYAFALSMSPEDVEAVAAQLYVEMLEAGFTRVGEFHYLHHAPDGRAYDNIAELGVRIAAASAEAGIGLTLLPVFYAHATFGGAAPNARQRRFINTIDSFARLLEGVRKSVATVAGGVVGVAPHSLRAATGEELRAVAAMGAGGPVHIHVAEQVKEVEDCLAFSGRRPVELLFDSAAVDGRWCLIHATHMNDAEVAMTARSGAVAGLCPVTEANLGDGTFRATDFLNQGGRFGIGSDSNVQIGIGDELRQLEYSQRLLHLQRNVLGASGLSTGRRLFDAAVAGGNQALAGEADNRDQGGAGQIGAGSCGLAAGQAADFLSLDVEHPALVGREGDALIDAWVFTGARAVDCVWAQGVKVVAGGRHRHREAVARRFAGTMRRLRNDAAHATGG